ncbi:aldose 1-epimerase family protein [Amphibacillus sp. Q70]|uniref:aldose 1-epimerase family protein n=1 Tax=Amphibacillus sp. Q70 TaxID=3453416 RepID=UPI003F84B3A5
MKPVSNSGTICSFFHVTLYSRIDSKNYLRRWICIIKLYNEICMVTISTHGAELLSMKNIATGYEYIWQANSSIWNRSAPFLFPIIGKLKDNTYFYQNRKFELGQHGFLRDVDFRLDYCSEEEAVFSFSSTTETLKIYPFDFKVTIQYLLIDNCLSIKSTIKNVGKETMYFSFGNHIGFTVPINPNLSFEDYFIEILPKRPRYRISLNKEKQADIKNAVLEETQEFQLNHEIFKNDALIFQTEGKTEIQLKTNKDYQKLNLTYENFPYLGIWSPYPTTGNLVCIQPWCGIADRIGTKQVLEQKDAIESLDQGKSFTRKFEVSIF